MRRIWAPWRMKYVQTHESGCIFCELQKQPDGIENMVVFRGRRAFVILNRYPYTSGHVMVVANAHYPSFEDLDPTVRAEMMELVAKCLHVLRNVYNPEAFNVGANIGKAAGAGVAEHIHLHVIPRWTGDANFMSTVAETRVIPENLEDTYRRVKEAWKKL